MAAVESPRMLFPESFTGVFNMLSGRRSVNRAQVPTPTASPEEHHGVAYHAPACRPDGEDIARLGEEGPIGVRRRAGG